ncbi:MAG: hypothetical protein L3J39_08295 [Verrucomicrobiales bacterium]|nr:hypothetical protein [Verrucomicrobiales bacterium]
MITFSRAILFFFFSASFAQRCAANDEQVILVHGLCRSSQSMQVMERYLKASGYQVLNLNYPSRSASIKQLSDNFIGKAVQQCLVEGAGKIHFVTHSMGGILVRSYLKRHRVPQLGKVVMLAPPNQGSEVVTRLGSWKLFQWINGPAGGELGITEHSTPRSLGRADFPLGVIAGSRSINWINSLIISGADDGKVSIEHTKVAGMNDHLVIKTAHPFIMNHHDACEQTVHFLRHSHFFHRS